MCSPGPACTSFWTLTKPRSSFKTSGLRALILDDPPVVNLSPDSTDNPILAAAVARKASLIVSGDKRHMLALGKVKGIPVVTARDALARVSHLFTHLY